MRRTNYVVYQLDEKQDGHWELTKTKFSHENKALAQFNHSTANYKWIVRHDGGTQEGGIPELDNIIEGNFPTEKSLLQPCFASDNDVLLEGKPHTRQIQVGEEYYFKYTICIVDDETRLVDEYNVKYRDTALELYREECRNCGYEVILYECDTILRQRPQLHDNNEW